MEQWVWRKEERGLELSVLSVSECICRSWGVFALMGTSDIVYFTWDMLKPTMTS